jgi:hypothetical protein
MGRESFCARGAKLTINELANHFTVGPQFNAMIGAVPQGAFGYGLLLIEALFVCVSSNVVSRGSVPKLWPRVEKFRPTVCNPPGKARCI